MVQKELTLPNGKTITYEGDSDDLDRITGVAVYVVLMDGEAVVHTSTDDGVSARWDIHDSGALIIRNSEGKTVACYGPAAWKSVQGN